MTVDKYTLDKAKKWAEPIDQRMVTDGVSAAAEVIRDLPDVIVDGDKVREVINAQLDSHPHGTVGHQVAEELACKLQALLPAPQPRTLAEMSPKEREACQWMQATVFDEEDQMTGIIQLVSERDPNVWVMFKSGRRNDYRLEEVVPLLDRPGMVWPSAEPVTESSEPTDAQEPRKLTSFREYKSAGVGTVVRDGRDTTTKEDHSYWRDTDGIDYTDGEMADTSRTVLWEPEA